MGSKKRRRLVVLEYSSGIIGKGKPKTKVVTSVLTPYQYEKRYYSSDEHSRTENAIEVAELK